MLNIKQRKERGFDDIQSLDDILEILKTQFKTRKLHLKFSVDKTEVQVNEILEDKSIIIVTDSEYSPGDDTIIIYGLLDKYLELDLGVIEVLGPGYFKCKIRSVRKAAQGRRDLRFKINQEDVVATNFKFSKHTIELSGYNIPTGIKVILDQFQSSRSDMSDIVRVDVFQSGDPILDRVKKTGQAVFLEDTSSPESYKALNDDFVDLTEVLGDGLKNYMKRNIEKGYKSVVICPLLYITDEEKSIPFAYIQLISTKETMGIEKMLDVKDKAFKLVDRIRDANTVLLSVHQQIDDISRGGVKLKITDENLKKYLIKARGFIFDIVFKLQAPITIYGEIKFTNYDDRGNLYIGVDFAGNSSRKDEMKRYYSMIKPRETEYKNNLMKELRRKKQLQ